MYPTNTFRIAFDTAVTQHGEPAGIKCYLKLLHMAKHHGQINVEAELRRVLDSGETIDPKAIIDNGANRSIEFRCQEKPRSPGTAGMLAIPSPSQ